LGGPELASGTRLRLHLRAPVERQLVAIDAVVQRGLPDPLFGGCIVAFEALDAAGAAALMGEAPIAAPCGLVEVDIEIDDAPDARAGHLH
jgi:hypothetical protein